MAAPVLSIKGLSLRAEGKLVLQGVDFDLPPTGITALMGPVGTGKSTLIKWLCGKADPEIYEAEVDEARYFYATLSRRNRPLLYGQRQGQTVEQMMMLITVHLQSNPPLLCIDEATADLTEAETEQVMGRLSILAQSRALLVVSHNQQQMSEYADTVMLLAGGKVQEITPARQFFKQPQSEGGRQFLGSGWVEAPSLGAPSQHLRPDLRELPFALEVAPASADGRLRTVCEDRMFVYDLPEGGPPPGPEDIALLKRSGITAAVFLDPQRPAEIASFDEGGLRAVWSKQPRQTFSAASAKPRGRALQPLLDAGEVPVFIARPGDPAAAQAIAAQLVFMRLPAMSIVELYGQLLGTDAVDASDEQVFWDLELELDLETDGVDAQNAQVEQPDISWIEDQVPRARASNTAPKQACGNG